jgi:phosphoglycolate phosphatase
MRALIWDLDGTLVDSSADLAAAVNAARAAASLAPLDEVVVRSAIGDGMDQLLRRTLPELGEAGLPRAREDFRSAYAIACARHTIAYAGISELLAAATAAHWRQAVVTNKPLSFALRILEHLRLRQHFTSIIGGDGVKKPRPDGVIAALAACGALAAPSWMIGDHHTDLQAGRAAGLRTAFCTWGLGHDNDVTPDYRCNHVNELHRLLA